MAQYKTAFVKREFTKKNLRILSPIIKHELRLQFKNY